tara:strand:+ start:2630 stop:2779 length:150 start_codon:yes stop_codon:yes gene_type:complete
MGDATDDLLDNDHDFHDDDPLVMCTGCGCLVKDSQTKFKKGKDYCTKCE